MSATQTITTTTREWKSGNDDTKKTGKAVAKAYSNELKKVKTKAKSSARRCPTCGRPL